MELYNGYAGDEIIEINGYQPWWVPKYTDAKGVHPEFAGAVEAEWHYSDVYGYYNAITTADAFAANMSLYSKIPELPEYKQTGDRAQWYNASIKARENTDLSIKNYNYVCIYMGDFDSAAWANQFMPDMFLEDPIRQQGLLPLCWPVVTNSVHRAPHVYNRMYQTATPSDYFTEGDNGYGYSNAGSYYSPERPARADGRPLNGDLATSKAKNAAELLKFDIDFHSFLLSTHGECEPIEKLWAELCPNGIFSNFTRPGSPVPGLIDYKNTPDNYDDDVPFQPLSGLSTTPGKMEQVRDGFVASLQNNPNGPSFTSYRAILTPPQMIYDAVNSVPSTYNIRIVDPYTYMRLYKESIIKALLQGGAQ
jgi:hypothetical protein